MRPARRDNGEQQLAIDGDADDSADEAQKLLHHSTSSTPPLSKPSSPSMWRRPLAGSGRWSTAPSLILLTVGLCMLALQWWWWSDATSSSLFSSSISFNTFTNDLSLDPPFPPAPLLILPPTAVPVCSAEGQQRWATRYADAHPSPLTIPPSPLTSSHWSSLNAPLDPSENVYNYSQLHTLPTVAPENARHVAGEITSFMVKLIEEFLFEPYFHPPPPHPWTSLPPFPFPSIPRLLPPATRHPIREGIVPVPNYNASDPLYHEGGARIPLNYSAYATDAQLLDATWPGCFDGVEARKDHTTDVAAFLRLYHQHSDNATHQAQLLHPRHLNTLALSLNLDKFPFERFPPPGVDSVPLIITTIDSEEFRRSMPEFAGHMRRVLGIHDSSVFINMETVRADTLQLLVEHLDMARVFLYFTPIQECTGHMPYPARIAKDWKINVSLLYILHVVFNLWDYLYAVVLEDDMDPSRDVYLYHLALSSFAVHSPDVFIVAGSSYSRFYDCYHLVNHLSHNFSQPDIRQQIDCPADGQPNVTQADLLAFDFTDTNLLAMERVIIPWAAGYTRKYYAFLLNFFLTFTGALGWQRYDITAHRIFGAHTYMRTLVPLTGRVHGDPVFLHKGRRNLPLLSSCQHTQWEVVAPRSYKQVVHSPAMAYYDHVV